MEQSNQTRGDADEITTPEPVIAPDETTGTIYERPPVTFTAAEAHNPYALLVELYEHAVRRVSPERTDAADHLTELALSAAVVAWWSRWQPIMMHRALVAGASLAEVAASVQQQLQRWADAVDITMVGLPPGQPWEQIEATLHAAAP